MSSKRFIPDDKDAQSDTLHERSKNRNELIKNFKGNNREIVTELNSENSSTHNDEDVYI